MFICHFYCLDAHQKLKFVPSDPKSEWGTSAVLKMKLRFIALSANIAKEEQTEYFPRPVVMMLRWWDPSGYWIHSA